MSYAFWDGIFRGDYGTSTPIPSKASPQDLWLSSNLKNKWTFFHVHHIHCFVLPHLYPKHHSSKKDASSFLYYAEGTKKPYQQSALSNILTVRALLCISCEWSYDFVSCSTCKKCVGTCVLAWSNHGLRKVSEINSPLFQRLFISRWRTLIARSLVTHVRSH